MDRHWLITWTCYGTWLSGDVRGFVANVADEDGKSVCHNVPGAECAADMPGLEGWVRQRMKASPVALDASDATAMVAQYQETAQVRGWTLQAASVMVNHTHVVVSVCGDPDPDSILETLKSWATRKLKKLRPLPANGSFWTAKGSTRKLPNNEALQHGVIYTVKKQPRPLAVWYAPAWQEVLAQYDRSLASRAP
jgi:hypothetical protein